VKKSLIVLFGSFCINSLQAQIVNGLEKDYNPNDLGFGIGDGAPSSSVSNVMVQFDGKIIVAGSLNMDF